MPKPSQSSSVMCHLRQDLQPLIPPTSDVKIIIALALDWIPAYCLLFPESSMKSQSEIVAGHSRVKSESADPMDIAVWLLFLTITASLVPQEDADRHLANGTNLRHFAKRVCKTINDSIVSHDIIGGTMEGIEVILLLVRVHFIEGKFRTCWLKMRRALALAELNGLPLASQTLQSAQSIKLSPGARQKLEKQANLWRSICAIDRLACMLLHLPSGTKAYEFPARSASSSAESLPRSLIWTLSGLAVKLYDLEKLISGPEANLNVVTKLRDFDQDLHNWSTSLPAHWWHSDASGLTQADSQVAPLIFYWYWCVRMRGHLVSKLKFDGNEPSQFSRATCLNASVNALKMYTVFRTNLAPAFLLSHVVDTQAFTAIAILILDGKDGDLDAPVLTDEVVHNAVETMKLAATQVAGGTALRAAEAADHLRAAFRNDTMMRKETILHVPLLGRIRISPRRHRPTEQEQQIHRQANTRQPMTRNKSAPDLPSSATMTWSSGWPADMAYESLDGVDPWPLNFASMDSPFSDEELWAPFVNHMPG